MTPPRHPRAQAATIRGHAPHELLGDLLAEPVAGIGCHTHPRRANSGNGRAALRPAIDATRMAVAVVNP